MVDGASIDDAFGHGYVAVSDTSLLAREAAGWRRRLQFGSLLVGFHDRTAYGSAAVADGSLRVLLVGHPVDLDAPSIEVRQIARRALDALRLGGLESFTHYVAYLAGRFTALAATGSEIVVMPDTCATQSIFWHQTSDRRLSLASHVELVASSVGAQVDDAAIERVERLRELNPRKTHYFAGIETAYVGVRPVIANCRLRVRADGSVRHERFYPFQEVRPPGSLDNAYSEFRTILHNTVRLLARFGRVGISLTAGLDSGSTLRVSLPHLPRGSFTFTYLNPRDRSEAHLNDTFVANRLSFEMGLPHRVLRWERPEPGSLFDQVFSRTWKAIRPSDGAACAMYNGLPRDFFQFQSMHAEVGTVFYKRRTDDPVSPRRLAQLFQGPRVAAQEEYVGQFEDFISYADFHDNRFHGLDYHDMFYWEHRDTRWAPQKPHEGDLGHRVLQPFNNRKLLEVMLSLPYEARLEKVLLNRLHSEPLQHRSGDRQFQLSRPISRVVERLKGRDS